MEPFTLTLTELIQELTDDIRQQEDQLRTLANRFRASKVAAGIALFLCLYSMTLMPTAPFINYLWLTLAIGAMLVALVSHKRCELLKALIAQNRWFRSIVVEEAYTGKVIGPEL